MRLCRGVCGGHRRVSTSQPKSQGEHTAGFRFSSSQRAGRKPGQEVLQNQEQAVPEKELCHRAGHSALRSEGTTQRAGCGALRRPLQPMRRAVSGSEVPWDHSQAGADGRKGWGLEWGGEGGL